MKGPKKLEERQLRFNREAIPTVPYDPNGNYVGKGALQSQGYMALAIGTTAVNLGPAPTGATSVLIRVEGGTIRFRDDGVMPTATIGFPLYSGDFIEYDAITSQFWAIRASGEPVLHALFYGYQ